MRAKVIKVRRMRGKMRRNVRWITSAKPGHRFERTARRMIMS